MEKREINHMSKNHTNDLEQRIVAVLKADFINSQDVATVARGLWRHWGSPRGTSKVAGKYMEDTMTHKNSSSQPQTLEQRIGAALTAPNTTSPELLTLLDEVWASITQADKDAAAEREKALRLQARMREIKKAEEGVEWELDYKQVEAQRDELATEFADIYPRVVNHLVGLFQRWPDATTRSCV
jgi:hypothetical protein